MRRFFRQAAKIISIIAAIFLAASIFWAAIAGAIMDWIFPGLGFGGNVPEEQLFFVIASVIVPAALIVFVRRVGALSVGPWTVCLGFCAVCSVAHAGVVLGVWLNSSELAAQVYDGRHSAVTPVPEDNYAFLRILVVGWSGLVFALGTLLIVWRRKIIVAALLASSVASFLIFLDMRSESKQITCLVAGFWEGSPEYERLRRLAESGHRGGQVRFAYNIFVNQCSGDKGLAASYVRMAQENGASFPWFSDALKNNLRGK